MNTKSKLLTMLILGTGAAACTAILNKSLSVAAASKHLLGSNEESLCFKWRFGDIHYTKRGSGKPVLLIHSLSSFANSEEWSALLPHLTKEYTVYTLDLLGCGLSEKPNLTYTNYLYVQLISDFIKSEIGRRTDVITSGFSSSIALMACSMAPDLFDQLIFINPEPIYSSNLYPGKNARLYKLILDTPILGTLIYNISCTRKAIRHEFMSDYFYNPFAVRDSYIDLFYESAHLGKSPKSFYASVKCNYTKAAIATAIKKIDNSITILCGDSIPSCDKILEEYKAYNAAVETYKIPRTKQMPHLEKPDLVCSLIQTM